VRRHSRRHWPQRIPAGQPLPDTRLWYAVDETGVLHARLPYMQYRAALEIARCLLPEVARVDVVLYAQLPLPLRQHAGDAPLLTSRAAALVAGVAGGAR